MINIGTSGFRGIIGDTWTKETIQQIGFAFRSFVDAQKKKVKLVIGFDNRFMGREFAVWFCEAVCCDAIRATFMNIPVPTPFIGYKAVTADFGIMITASHNPFFYNGIKILLHGGRDADDEFFGEIKKHLDKKYDTASFEKLVKTGIVTFSADTETYVDKIAAQLDVKKIKNSGLRVLLNPIHGSGASVTRRLFEKIGLEYNVVNENPDPLFGGKQPAPYPYFLTDMAQEVVKGKYNFGVAFDGDADRIAVIDGDGKIYECNYIAPVLFYHLTQIKKQKGGAVKTVVTSNLIAKLCSNYGFKIHETLTGFKFIGSIWEQTDALIGAENGGVGIRAVSLYKDGITAAALLTDLFAATGKSFGNILREICDLVSFPTATIEYAYLFEEDDREALLKKLLSDKKPNFDRDIVEVQKFFDGFKIKFKDDYWCCARMSGTENVFRLYAEMPDTALCEKTISIMEEFFGVTEKFFGFAKARQT